MTYTNTVAPYPTDAAEVTTESIIKCMAVAAQQRTAQRKAPAQAAADPKTLTIEAFLAEFGVAFLLRVLANVDPYIANEAAGDLWDHWEDPDAAHEALWEWLTEYGIDPGRVSDETSKLMLEPDVTLHDTPTGDVPGTDDTQEN
jgi:hypothetical protein